MPEVSTAGFLTATNRGPPNGGDPSPRRIGNYGAVSAYQPEFGATVSPRCMTRENLIELYPKIYDQTYFGCGDGWNDILADSALDLMLLLQRTGLEARALSARELFGVLSLTIDCPSSIALDVATIEAKAEAESSRTCELCGSPGRPGWARRHSWYCTLCDPCREKNNNVP